MSSVEPYLGDALVVEGKKLKLFGQYEKKTVKPVFIDNFEFMQIFYVSTG